MVESAFSVDVTMRPSTSEVWLSQRSLAMQNYVQTRFVENII